MVAEPKPKKTRRVRREPVVTVAKMTSKGQITVPKSIREYLGLDAGDTVAFSRHEDGVLIQRHVGASPFTKWRGYLKDLKGEDVDRLVDEMRGY
jgi:AbrB family looped-hinge helix DNA binding protein